MKLLLWDIDGALLSTGGAGMRALEEAVTSEFQPDKPVDLSDIDWAGRTDRWISGMIFGKYAIENSPANVDRLLDAYIARLPRFLDSLTEVLPGVREILDEAQSRPDIVQGLLTGNVERGAAAKLGHFGLWDYFPFGAFADDSAVRNDLGPHALRRATDHSGRTFDSVDVWIIGDTPHDIECGKVIGARTLAVATGHHTEEELSPHAPDAIRSSLEDVDQFWGLLK